MWARRCITPISVKAVICTIHNINYVCIVLWCNVFTFVFVQSDTSASQVMVGAMGLICKNHHEGVAVV